MLKVTTEAAFLLKAAKEEEGAPRDAGIRIQLRAAPKDPDDLLTAVGLTISDEPKSGDKEFEQDGLRIFVEDRLVEPLEHRTLDVREDEDGAKLLFR
jgi:Fe-S cluster assembly iron-binding protein IscA